MKKVMFEFSGIYHRQEALRQEMDGIVDCRGLTGTDCYCDPATRRELLSRAKLCGAKGIHLLDSGNYHYMSRIFLETCGEEVSLVAADNHTDMQAPALLPVLSCGSWLLDTLRELPNVREVFLIGPPGEALSQIPEEYRSRVFCISKEELSTGKWREKLRGFRPRCRVYYSVDKDILAPEECRTNWDQGELRLCMLLEILGWFRKNKGTAGADICGEPDEREASDEAVLASMDVSRKLIEWFDREECG